MAWQKKLKYADNLFLLYGDKSKKELQKIREQMEQVPANETMILVATGQMVGGKDLIIRDWTR